MEIAPQPDRTPERGRVSALALLLPFARPYAGLIAAGDRAGLLPLLGLALFFGLAEAALFFLRRWAMNRSSFRLERDLRDAVYQRLQRLPIAFHDRWSSGQLLSRATTDVSTIRQFVGFSAVFLAVNLITCVVVLVLLLVTYWPLELTVLLTTVPLTFLGARWERRYNVQSRRVQDQQGEL